MDDWFRGGFVKLYGDRLAGSSLLETAVATRWVFVFMLSQADSDGRFRAATLAALARAANVTLDEASRAVAELEAPDPNSSTPEQEGRRVHRIDGGWQIVNYRKYREFRSEKQFADAARQRRKYSKQRETSRRSPKPHVRSRAEAEAEAEAEGETTLIVGRQEIRSLEANNEFPTLPPADRAERAIRHSTDALRTKLYALIDEMSRIDPEGRDPTELMRRVTEYETKDGRHVNGVVNASLLTHERLEKSIVDAEAAIAEWSHGRFTQAES